MADPVRLDLEIVARGLARSRAHAAQLVDRGAVTVDGAVVRRAAHKVRHDTTIDVAPDPLEDYASRGALKLLSGLQTFGDIPISDAVCLDAGASTGGFTDVLLEMGAATVYAYDVGTGQLIDRLANDPRVVAKEKCNVRHLRAGDLDPAPSVVVADLSFISLTLVVSALVDVAANPCHYVLLVKPQFEVGKGKLSSTGVVRDTRHRRDAVAAVVDAAFDAGATLRGCTESDTPGQAGNVEYFVWLTSGDEHSAPTSSTQASDMIDAMFPDLDDDEPSGPLGVV